MPTRIAAGAILVAAGEDEQFSRGDIAAARRDLVE
jgi:hypothetical protein